MATKIVCDICGEDLSDNSGRANVGDVNWIGSTRIDGCELIREHIEIEVEIKSDQKDVCQDCLFRALRQMIPSKVEDDNE